MDDVQKDRERLFPGSTGLKRTAESSHTCTLGFCGISKKSRRNVQETVNMEQGDTGGHAHRVATSMDWYLEPLEEMNPTKEQYHGEYEYLGNGETTDMQEME